MRSFSVNKLISGAFFSYFWISIFFPYVASLYLNRISFTLAAFLGISIVAIGKKLLPTRVFQAMLAVITWMLWFYLCLMNNGSMIAYQNMMVAIGLILLFSILLVTSYEYSISFFVVGLISASITIVITLGYLAINKDIVRLMATGYDEVTRYIGIGGYDFSYALALLIPCAFLHFRYSSKFEQVLLMGFILFAEYYFFYCGLATTLLISLCGIFLMLLLDIQEKTKRYLCISALILALILLLTVGQELLRDSLANFNISSSFIQDKVSDILRFLSGEKEEYGTITGRITRYAISWGVFIKSPLLGCLWDNQAASGFGGHATLLDYLALTGIVGMVLFIVAVSAIHKLIADVLQTNEGKNTFRVTLAVFMIASLLKSTHLASLFFTVFCAVPMYIKSVEKKYLVSRNGER